MFISSLAKHFLSDYIFVYQFSEERLSDGRKNQHNSRVLFYKLVSDLFHKLVDCTAINSTPTIHPGVMFEFECE